MNVSIWAQRLVQPGNQSAYVIFTLCFCLVLGTSECPEHRHQAQTWKTALSSLSPLCSYMAWSRAGIVDSLSMALTHLQGNVSPLHPSSFTFSPLSKFTSVMLFFSVQDNWREQAALYDVCCCCGRWPCRVSWVRASGRSKAEVASVVTELNCHPFVIMLSSLLCFWSVLKQSGCSMFPVIVVICFALFSLCQSHIFSAWFWAQTHTKEKNAHCVYKYLGDGLIVGGPLCLWSGENAARGTGLCPVSPKPLTLTCSSFISS